MRVLVLTAAKRLPDLGTLYAELGKRVDLTVMRLDKQQQRNLRKALRSVDLRQFHRIMLDLPIKNVYQKTRYLSVIEGLLVYDEDACQNYLSNSRWYGRFSRFYKRLPQARVLVTGASVAKRLQAEGFDVSFAPKGYDPAQQFVEAEAGDLQQRDIELGFIGRTASAAYAGRKELLEALARVEPVQMLRTEPGEAYRHMLNRIRLFVSADVGLDEYMAKNFEAMACGCVLLAWRQGHDETAIGLRDGEHLLLYSSLAELREHIAVLRRNPQRAQQIADAGRAFAEQHLSYAHLAARIADLLAEPWPAVAPLGGWRAVWRRLNIF